MSWIALVAGFLGADSVNLIMKKLGLTKGLNIRVAKPMPTEFDERQLAVLEYLKTHDRITNRLIRRSIKFPAT